MLIKSVSHIHTFLLLAFQHTRGERTDFFLKKEEITLFVFQDICPTSMISSGERRYFKLDRTLWF